MGFPLVTTYSSSSIIVVSTGFGYNNVVSNTHTYLHKHNTHKYKNIYISILPVYYIVVQWDLGSNPG